MRQNQDLLYSKSMTVVDELSISIAPRQSLLHGPQFIGGISAATTTNRYPTDCISIEPSLIVLMDVLKRMHKKALSPDSHTFLTTLIPMGYTCIWLYKYSCFATR